MKAIVCVEDGWAIGKNGELLYRISKDLKSFKEYTLGKTVIFGRKTLDTFPGKKALPGRKNFVLTHNTDFEAPEDITPLHSIEEVLELARDSENPDDIIIIGGASIYKALIPYCSEVFLTRVQEEEKEADAFFPNLRESEDWYPHMTTAWETEIDKDGQRRFFRFETWKNRNPVEL